MHRVSVPSSRVAIVGAGVSTLLLELVTEGYTAIDAIDISAAALDQLRDRLGPDSGAVRFVCADVRNLELGHRVDVWHDRAVFHFLVDEADQQRYQQVVTKTVAPGGHLVIATFAIGGPDRCSGLPVVQWSAVGLAELFGEEFDMIDSCSQEHQTPWGASQAFTHALFRRH